ncbi:hypothetical protein [Pseudomonas fluorescens]|uniref:Uncharacterized protein n=1 Tax=Pseudomonas fluorescens TaxID=294 RepID=A0A5E7B6G0_PSEFL|nr:hypothetical protein PS691_01504 [Pseudomonas fluorescens]
MALRVGPDRAVYSGLAAIVASSITSADYRLSALKYVTLISSRIIKPSILRKRGLFVCLSPRPSISFGLASALAQFLWRAPNDSHEAAQHVIGITKRGQIYFWAKVLARDIGLAANGNSENMLIIRIRKIEPFTQGLVARNQCIAPQKVDRFKLWNTP